MWLRNPYVSLFPCASDVLRDFVSRKNGMESAAALSIIGPAGSGKSTLILDTALSIWCDWLEHIYQVEVTHTRMRIAGDSVKPYIPIVVRRWPPVKSLSPGTTSVLTSLLLEAGLHSSEVRLRVYFRDMSFSRLMLQIDSLKNGYQFVVLIDTLDGDIYVETIDSLYGSLVGDEWIDLQIIVTRAIPEMLTVVPSTLHTDTVNQIPVIECVIQPVTQPQLDAMLVDVSESEFVPEEATQAASLARTLQRLPSLYPILSTVCFFHLLEPSQLSLMSSLDGGWSSKHQRFLNISRDRWMASSRLLFSFKGIDVSHLRSFAHRVAGDMIRRGHSMITLHKLQTAWAASLGSSHESKFSEQCVTAVARLILSPLILAHYYPLRFSCALSIPLLLKPLHPQCLNSSTKNSYSTLLPCNVSMT